ncbi:hypothetical protein [Pleionea sediminis]|uniref:hypothetical protein n=1 Tax=Pleionea sediminis TaxID=2569479 RepID=UPI00118639AB|nr:hypothetical protein [Pleionea sediminis]
MIEQELKTALNDAAEYFGSRGITDWRSEALKAVQMLESGDLSFVESLWLKYAPTCDIDDLLIINADPEDEDKVNSLNAELAKIANRTFAILDRLKNEKT